MESNENKFQTIKNENTYYRKDSSFKRSVVLPFFSGVLGCSLVLGTCFGVPSIKEKLIGNVSSSVSTAGSNFISSASSGTVDHISLKNYSDTAVYAANKILPSIVGIEVTYNITSNNSYLYSIFGYGSGSPSTSSTTASGSGIIISKDGYILTNNHVVASSSESSYYEISEATSVKIKLYDETEYSATIVGKDSQTDLAVLKIEADNLTVAEFANSDNVKVGEFAMAVGNPLGLESSITCGVVSAVNRTVTDSEGTSYKSIQTDAAINSGNSGGALVNSEGKVIGVNTLKLSGTGIEGIGFAIPINSTIDITDQLIQYQFVKRPYIGISGITLDENTAKKNNLVVGIYVKSVEDFSAAEKAGIKPGDVITKADGKDVKNMDELNEIKNSHSIGDEMTITVNRNGNEKNLTVTLGESKN